jgi:hypothetical protein
MKYLLPLLLLPSLALAQPPAPQGQSQQPPDFNAFKQSMQPVIEKSLPAMKETRECVSKAQTQEDVKKCMQAMAKKAQAIKEELAGSSDTPPVASKVPDDFKWDPETKKLMLQNMDRSIKMNTSMQECLGKSSTREEMGECMRSKMPVRKNISDPDPLLQQQN